METQQLKQIEANAWKHYDSTDAAGKQVMHEIFGADFFKRSITDKVKTFEDACAVLGILPAAIITNGDTVDEAAYKKLKIIAKTLNEGWKPNWENDNEYKYFPYFNMNNGFSFSGSDYYCLCQYSGVGSRLCFRNRELCDYAATQFIDIYRAYFTI